MQLRWTRTTALALAIAAAPSVAMIQDGPVTVRFTTLKATVEDHNGGVIDSLWLMTLGDVRYRTTHGDRIIIFGQGGPTTPYNTHLHGGDVTLKSWTGRSRSLWVHRSGGVTGGRNDDWTLNSH